MLDLNAYGWMVSIFSAILIGISKTGIPGSAMLAIPLMAGILPARSSTGAVLILLIFADIFAASYYKRDAVMKHILRLMPYALAGILAGYAVLGRISDNQLRPVIGVIILIMLFSGRFFLQNDKTHPAEIRPKKWAAPVLGLTAGAATMMANAAGPILIIYLSSMRLPKRQFVGTSAWYFLILNWVKVPFSAGLGFITLESLKFNAVLFPAVALGAAAGILVLKKIPRGFFQGAVRVLAGAAALQLILNI